ncbi:MAG: MCP four helix bundle domain-containing protein, partial [Alphaproteobacteria bacterium]
MNIFARKQPLQIRGRLIAGFTVICAILIAAVGITLFQVSAVSRNTDRIVDLRVPTASASASIASNIHQSLASLRGWMITGNPSFKTERANVWQDIHQLVARLDGLSATWTNPKNVARWGEFKVVLLEFEVAQAQVETIAGSAEEQPATQLLTVEAAPRAAAIIEAITAMIDEEADLRATTERKALLGMMADVRGS